MGPFIYGNVYRKMSESDRLQDHGESDRLQDHGGGAEEFDNYYARGNVKPVPTRAVHRERPPSTGLPVRKDAGAEFDYVDPAPAKGGARKRSHAARGRKAKTRRPKRRRARTRRARSRRPRIRRQKRRRAATRRSRRKRR